MYAILKTEKIMPITKIMADPKHLDGDKLKDLMHKIISIASNITPIRFIESDFDNMINYIGENTNGFAINYKKYRNIICNTIIKYIRNIICTDDSVYKRMIYANPDNSIYIKFNPLGTASISILYEKWKISIELINYKSTFKNKYLIDYFKDDEVLKQLKMNTTYENKHFIDYEVLKQLKMNRNCFKIDKEIKKYSKIQNYQSLVNYTNDLLSNYDFYTITDFKIMNNVKEKYIK